MDELHGYVTTVVILLTASLVVSVIAERVGVPYVVALLLVAAPVTLSRTLDEFGGALLFVFLPALIFEAAWNTSMLQACAASGWS